MIETMQLFFQIIQWVGSLFGLIGGIILIVRFLKERPIIKIDKFSSYHVVSEEEKTVFLISLDIDNIGDKPTTIKDIFFFLLDKKKGDYRLMSGFEDFKMFHLSPQSSMKFSEKIIMDVSVEENIEIWVIIDHTHGCLDKKTESYFSHDNFNYDNDDYGGYC